MSDVPVAPMSSVLAHGATVSAVRFSPDGQYVASASRDKLLKIFAWPRMEELRSLRGHNDRVNCVAFSKKESHVLASGSKDKTVKIWNFQNGNCIRTLRGHASEVHSVAFSTDGRQLASASEDMVVILWDVESGDEVSRLEGHTGGVLTVAYGPPGRRTLVSGSDDTTMRLWHTQTAGDTKVFSGHTDAVTDARFSPVDTQVLVSSSRDKTVRFWHSETGDVLGVLSGHKDVVNQAVFSNDGWRLVTASGDNSLKLWDLDTLKEMRRFEGHKGAVAGCDFSADCKSIVSASWDATLKIWPHGADASKHSQQRPFSKGKLVPETSAGSEGKLAQPSSAQPSPKASPSVTRKDLAPPGSPSTQARSAGVGATGPQVARPVSPAEEKIEELEKEKERWKNAEYEVELALAEEKKKRREQEEESQAEKVKIASLSEVVLKAQQHEKEVEHALQGRLKSLQALLSAEVKAREEAELVLAQERERWHLPKSELEVGTEFASGPAAHLFHATWAGAPVVVKRFNEPLRSQYYVTVWESQLSTRMGLLHPNIATFFGAILEPHQAPQLVLEPLAGSLSEAAAMSEHLTLREIVSVAADIGAALAFLHKRNVAHGSVCGKKILLSSLLHGKLSCIGEHAAVEVSFTRAPTPNPEVLPPEGPARGDPVRAAKADVYGFGVALLELATQTPPVASKRNSQLAHVSDDILKNIIQKCIEENPEERADIHVILDFLRKLLTPGTYPDLDACPPVRHIKRSEYGLVFDTPVKARKLPSTPSKD